MGGSFFVPLGKGRGYLYQKPPQATNTNKKIGTALDRAIPIMLCRGGISRVLFSAETESLPFIYDADHSTPLATYPPTLDE